MRGWAVETGSAHGLWARRGRRARRTTEASSSRRGTIAGRYRTDRHGAIDREIWVGDGGGRSRRRRLDGRRRRRIIRASASTPKYARAAAKGGHSRCVKFLCENRGVAVPMTSAYAAAKGGHAHVMRYASQNAEGDGARADDLKICAERAREGGHWRALEVLRRYAIFAGQRRITSTPRASGDYSCLSGLRKTLRSRSPRARFAGSAPSVTIQTSRTTSRV